MVWNEASYHLGLHDCGVLSGSILLAKRPFETRNTKSLFECKDRIFFFIILERVSVISTSLPNESNRISRQTMFAKARKLCQILSAIYVERAVVCITDIFESQRDKTWLQTCAPNEDLNQPVHLRSLIRVFVVSMKKLSILVYPNMHSGKIRIRLRECPVWSESSRGVHVWTYVSWRFGSFDGFWISVTWLAGFARLSICYARFWQDLIFFKYLRYSAERVMKFSHFEMEVCKWIWLKYNFIIQSILVVSKSKGSLNTSKYLYFDISELQNLRKK